MFFILTVDMTKRETQLNQSKTYNTGFKRMKKSLILTAIALMSTAPLFGQEKLVKEVERMVSKDDANLQQARELIAPALTNPESAEKVRTWYVAGLVEEKDVERGYIAQQMQKQVDMNAFYEAVYNMATYYLKADALDRKPDEDGDVDRKYEDELKTAFNNYYLFLVNGGAEHLNNNHFQKAHDFFTAFLKVKALPFFEGTKVAEQDSLAMEIGFFNAYTATQIKDNTEGAIKDLLAIKDTPYRQEDVYQLLSSTYLQIQDTLNYQKTLEEGAKLFPNSGYFLGNTINLLLTQNKYTEAKEYLQKVLASEVGNKEMYYNALADIYAQEGDKVKAEETYKKAIEIKPDYASAVMGIGRLYYNEALRVTSEATENINDAKKMKELDAKAKELFKKALPHLEKAVSLDATNKEYLLALRNIYYNLKMMDAYNEIEEKLKSL